MTVNPTESITGLAGLQPGDTMDSARLLGMIVALAGEVFVLKSEVARLKLALAERDTVDDAVLARAAASPAMRDWMAREESAFGHALLRPFTHPDEAPDISPFLHAK